MAHRRDVQLGVRQGDKVQVLSGVMPREDVVVVGGLGVDDKAKVKVVRSHRAARTDEDQPEDDSSAKDAKDQKKDEAKPKQK